MDQLKYHYKEGGFMKEGGRYELLVQRTFETVEFAWIVFMNSYFLVSLGVRTKSFVE